MNDRTEKQSTDERTLHIPHNNVVPDLAFHGRWVGLLVLLCSVGNNDVNSNNTTNHSSNRLTLGSRSMSWI